MIHAVIGLGFGDEGKGFTTDYLSHRYPNSIVIRFNGGHQAGHTVQLKDGKRHVFSNFGSGTLRGVPTYWTENCTVDPVGIMREHKVLESYRPILHLSPNCPVVTPFDKFYNQINPSTIHHGTCGVGFGETLEREENLYSLRVMDLLFDSVVTAKLALIKKYYADKYNRSVGKELDVDIKLFYKAVKFIFDCKDILISEFTDDYENYIMEGAQGILLDKNIGFFPHVTRSNTTYNEAVKVASDLFNHTVAVKPYFVTRAYQTRHGNGPMTNENIPISLSKDIVETNKDSEYQGKFRRTLLDLDLIQYGLFKQRLGKLSSNLMITCLDHLEEYAFTMEGEVQRFKEKRTFVQAIGECIPLTKENVFVSESLFAENVWKY